MLAVSLENPINQAFSVNPHITEAHFQEWVESGVDPEIIALNVKSLLGDEVFKYLIPDPGAVTKRVHPYAQWRYIRARYANLENGGWWVDGADPLNGYTLNQWGSFKPDTPHNKYNGFGAVENKKIKYEHPFGVPMRAIFLNEWKPVTGRLVTSYEKSTQMLAALEDEIRSGKRVFIITQSQKAKSKFGTINLEARWRQLFPNLRILRIDSDSVREPGHPALGCISKLNVILVQYDIVICSPTIETGVSIDIKGHFSSIWAFFQGVSPVNSACQSVARLREFVPLHVYAASRGLSFAGNQSVSYKSLISGQNKVFKSTLSLINFDGNNYTINATALTIWGKMGARVNAGMRDYNTSIIAALELEGHTVQYIDCASEQEEEAWVLSLNLNSYLAPGNMNVNFLTKC